MFLIKKMLKRMMMFICLKYGGKLMVNYQSSEER